MAACEQMAPTGPASHDEADALRARVAAFRTRHDSLTAERDALAAATASRAAELQRLTLQLSNLQDALDAARREIDAERHRAEVGKASYTQALAESRAEALEQKRRADAIEASTFWRATVIPRRLAERFRRLFELLTWSPVTPLA